MTRYEGEVQLWYLPAYGFRLVISQISPKKDALLTLSIEVNYVISSKVVQEAV